MRFAHCDWRGIVFIQRCKLIFVKIYLMQKYVAELLPIVLLRKICHLKGCCINANVSYTCVTISLNL